MQIFIAALNVIMMLAIASCHKSSPHKPATLSGKVTIDFPAEKTAGELFLAILKGNDFEKLQTHVVDSIVTIIPLDKNKPEFTIDATKLGLDIGSKISLVAFVEKNFKNGIPNLSPGDLAGLYLDKPNLSIAHTITPGENRDLNVSVNREYFAIQTRIKGVIKGDYTGDVIMIGYAGEVTSLSFNALDFDRIVAVQKFRKAGPNTPYTLDILPFCHFFPVNKAYIFVLFDENGNGKPDPGEKIAYYSANPKAIPTMVSIGDGATADLDANLAFTVGEGHSSDISISGKMIVPPDHSGLDKPIYAIVADAADPDALVQAPVKAIKAFQKLDEGSTEFAVDLSETDLKAGDKVTILGLEDRDGDGGFPDVTPGDFVGIYVNQASSSQTYVLKPGLNANIEVALSREVFAFDKKISGTISGDFKGNVLVVAYAGEITSMDKSQLDLNKIVGFSHFNKTDQQMRYSLPILPYGYNLPISGVYVFAVFDANNNGSPDPGESVGFYSKSPNGLPTRITIDSSDQSNIDITPVTTIAAPSGVAMSISGTVTLPADAASQGRPTFVVVAKGSNPDDVLTAPMESVKAFTKLAANQKDYKIDLSQTDLASNDEVMVVALWDANNDGGMPSANAGDIVGFYFNPTSFASTVKLAAGVNRDINIQINREVYSYDKSVSGTIGGDLSGDIVVMAYNGKIDSFDFSQFDYNHVLGYRKFKKGSSPLPYRLNILPLGYPLPINGVYVIGFLDKNGNGHPDAGELLGIYSHRSDKMPTQITIGDDMHTDINLDLTMKIATPSGANISLSGSLTPTAAALAAGKPIYVVVAAADSPSDITSRPMESIKTFAKVDATTGRYSIDLSKTDLVVGDHVMVMGLDDENNDGGFPSLSDGDYIGFYKNSEAMSATVTLNNGGNSDINLVIDQKVYGYNTSVSGRILSNYTGNVVVFAYNGPIDSMDLTKLDLTKIVATTSLDKSTSSPLDFQMKVLPFGQNLPLNNVMMFAIYDKNGNGVADPGESIGYYATANGAPPALTQISASSSTLYTISPRMTVTTPSGANIAVSGTLHLPSGVAASGKPVYVVIAKTDDPSAIQNDPMNSIKYFAKVDPTTGAYSFSLGSTDLLVGDNVMVIGLWDSDYVAGFPSLTTGDYIGYYKDTARMSATLTLASGGNSAVDVAVNQQVYNYKRRVTGTVSSNYTGNMVMFAYQREITSLDFKALNFDNVIGYGKFNKASANAASYALDILPYGHPLPLQGVYVFALFDSNGNGTADPGESIGFYTSRSDGMPTFINLDNEITTGINISPSTVVQKPSGYSIHLSGNISYASSLASQNKPLYLVVSDAANPTGIMDTPTQSIRFFQKLGINPTSYNVDLSSTDIKPGNEVMISLLWDHDYAGDFPSISEGDYVGFYINRAGMKMSRVITSGANTGLDISVDKQYFNFNKTVSGRINDDYIGKINVFAYNGPIDSMDFTKIDLNKVVAYTTLVKSSSSPLDFQMKVLPFGQNLPINNVMVFAFYDKNGNGTADPGESIGYYATADSAPPSLTQISASSSTLYTISPRMTIAKPSGANIAVSGTLHLPSGVAASGKPVYVVIAKADDPSAIQTDPMNSIKYFVKVDPTTGAYTINLGSTDLVVGDNVMVIGLWDTDYVAGFPSLTTGDYIGYYKDTSRMAATLTLANGGNSAVDVTVNQQVYNYKRSITGTISTSYTGNIVVFAYQGEITSLDFKALNFDNVIGYSKLTKASASSASYSLDILPYGHPLPLQGVYVFALFDSNGNGAADPGESIGFYTNRSDGMPSTIRLDNETTPAINLSPSIVIKKPSGYNINLSGSITLASSLASQNKPVYLLVSDASNPTGIMDAPMQSIRFFQKLGVNPTSYNVDISSTDIKPGDEVMIVLLWDHDYAGGFPSITEGDYVGFYINRTAMKMSRVITSGANSGLDISIDKQYFNFNKSISGRITDSYVGKINLIAYNGSIDSMDFSQIDVNHVVGYSSIYKGSSAPLDFSLRILPFNQNLPFYNVQLYATYDSNGNGTLDPGEQFGYYSNNSQSLPELTTVSSSSSTFYSVSAKTTIATPANQNIVLQGSVSMPSDYAASGKPAYIMVTRGNDISSVISHPVNSVETFQKIPLGSSSFSINLSKTTLRAGDPVMVLALWDKNFVAGFPSVTPGDRVGLYTNTSTMSLTKTLVSGVNTITTQGNDQFAITRTVYSHNSVIRFTLGGNGYPNLNQGDQVLMVAVQQGGTSNYRVTNLDYVVALKTYTISSLNSLTFDLPILTALKPEITAASPFGINSIYVYAVIDKNKNGLPDSGEPVGYFYQQQFIFYTPALTNIGDGINTLPRSVIFDNETF